MFRYSTHTGETISRGELPYVPSAVAVNPKSLCCLEKKDSTGTQVASHIVTSVKNRSEFYSLVLS